MRGGGRAGEKTELVWSERKCRWVPKEAGGVKKRKKEGGATKKDGG